MTNQPDTSTPESHVPEVLDNDHPGVQAVTAGDPDGWLLTLQHLQDTVMEIAESPWNEGEPQPTELVFRGEDREFSVMRTSMDRWADPNAEHPLEGWDNQNQRNEWYITYQKTLLALAFDSGISIPIHALDIKQNAIVPNNPLLSNSRLRRMMIRLQHQLWFGHILRPEPVCRSGPGAVFRGRPVPFREEERAARGVPAGCGGGRPRNWGRFGPRPTRRQCVGVFPLQGCGS